MSKHYFITGIDTGVGKTLVSAIITEKLKADYWKPIQSGDLDNSDTLAVKSLVSNTKTVFHTETYRLTQPLSPHLSAKMDGIAMEITDFKMPGTENNLVIEGAGGLMVPINSRELIIDLIKKLDAEVILVSRNYLGSINHTLLSLQTIRQYNLNLKGIIFNGQANKETQDYILNYDPVKLLGVIPELSEINAKVVLGLTGLVEW